MCEIHYQWSPGTERGARQDLLTAPLTPTQARAEMHTRAHAHAHTQVGSLLGAKGPEHGALARAPVRRCHPMMRLFQGGVFGDPQVAVCKPSLAWSLLGAFWANGREMSCLICREETGCSYLEREPNKGLQKEGEARGQISQQLPGQTCDYTFFILTTGRIRQLCLVVFLFSLAGFPVMSVAIRVELGINSYLDAPWSWESECTRMSWREGGSGPPNPSKGPPCQPFSPGCSLPSPGSLAIYI